MPDPHHTVTKSDPHYYLVKYTKYFNMRAPKSLAAIAALLIIGAISGTAMSFIVHYSASAQDYLGLLVSGMSTGLLVISLPALLTAAFMKAVKRKMRLQHALLVTAAITLAYALILLVASSVFRITGSVTMAYIILFVANAFVYICWFFIGKFVIGRGKSVIAIAATQPVLNTLLYLPLGGYILSLQVPLGTALIKLSSGMLVFLVAGYAMLYVVDRPVKRNMDISGIKLVVSMMSQWLYDLTSDASVIGKDASIKRDLSVDVLAIKGSGGYKAVFVNPDIHFGPFAGVGGSVAPSVLGDAIVRAGGSAPFILHSPLTLEDNPISTAQVRIIEKRLVEALGPGGMRFRRARGSATVGRRHSCTAINVAVGDANLLFLTRAPRVTEDMDRDLGMRFKEVASERGRGKVIVIDSHNSRFESASTRELDGVRAGSQYAYDYEAAIRSATGGARRNPMSSGPRRTRCPSSSAAPRTSAPDMPVPACSVSGRKGSASSASTRTTCSPVSGRG